MNFRLPIMSASGMTPPAGGNLQPMMPLPGQSPLMTREQIARQRGNANDLLAPTQQPVTNWADGTAGLVDAFNGVRQMRQADEAERQLSGFDRGLQQRAFGTPPVPQSMSMVGGPAAPPSFGGFLGRLFG